MTRRIVLALVVTVLLFFAGGLLLPPVVQVDRSIEIRRPPATVFELVNGFATFEAWAPWMERDPDMRYAVSDPPRGEGAWLEWRGDQRQVGAGRRQVVRSVPYRAVDLRVESDQLGLAGETFEIERIAGGARLTWRFRSDVAAGQGLVGAMLARFFGPFYDRWLGVEHERGLVRLKRFAESLPAGDFSGLRVEPVIADGADIVYRTVYSGAEPGQPSAQHLASAYRDLTGYIAANGLGRSGQPMAITRSGVDGWRIDAAIPVDGPGGQPEPPIRFGRVPAGAALRVVHRGPYDGIAPLYGKLAAWMAVRGLRGADVSWEQYLSDPAVTPPAERTAHLYVLLEE